MKWDWANPSDRSSHYTISGIYDLQLIPYMLSYTTGSSIKDNKAEILDNKSNDEEEAKLQNNSKI